MIEPIWILKEVVVALHEQLIAAFGGETGLRDPGLLESALARPKHLHTHRDPSIIDLAASYAFRLVKNHPFIDGNKRIGFTTAITFLEINGHRFTASEVDAVIQTLALAASELDEAGYAAWLAANSQVSMAARRARALDDKRQASGASSGPNSDTCLVQL